MSLRDRIDLLSGLLGAWRGQGQGGFPTVPAFAYEEELRFAGNEAEPLLHYEQRTWQRTAAGARGGPLHWESGFLIARDDGRYELSNSQNGGRVEVMEGVLDQGPRGALVLRFASRILANDPRMVASTREIVLDADALAYRVAMATRTCPQLTPHLTARLTRVR